MNKSITSFIFAPLLVLAIGAMATMAHAGTVVISGFSSPAKAMQIMKKTENIVFNNGVGNVFATCNGNKIQIDESNLIPIENRQILHACKKGDLTIFVSTIPQKVIIKQAKAEAAHK